MVKELKIFNLSYDSPDFLLNLNHLGIDLYNIKAGRIDNLPNSNTYPGDKGNSPSIGVELSLMQREVNVGL